MHDELSTFFLKWKSIFLSSVETSVSSHPSLLKKRTEKFSFAILFLRVLPFVCFLGFIVSFFWDFSGELSPFWRKDTITMDGLLGKITVTGLVGFLTNWIAIKMLFYPRKKRPLLGQGLIPARKERIILRLGEQISKEVINKDLILAKISESGILKKYRHKIIQNLREAVQNKEFRKDVFSLVQHYVHKISHSSAYQNSLRGLLNEVDFSNVGIMEGALFRLYKLLAGDKNFDEKIERIVSHFGFDVKQYDKHLGIFLDKLPYGIEEEGEALEESVLNLIVFLIEKINIQGVIVHNLKQFDETRLEKLLWGSTSSQLLYIQYLGCFLGIIGGLFLWLPYEAIVTLFLLGVSTWGLDSLLFLLRNKRS